MLISLISKRRQAEGVVTKKLLGILLFGFAFVSGIQGTGIPAWNISVSELQAAVVRLEAPENGATVETRLASELRFLENDALRSAKPEWMEAEMKRFAAYVEEYETEMAQAKKEGRKPKEMRNPESRFLFMTNNEWSKALMKEYAEEVKTFRPFRWTVEGEAREATVWFSETPDFANALREIVPTDENGVSASGVLPRGLLLGTKYFWKVTARDESGAEIVSDVREFCTNSDGPRVLFTPLVMNFRDIGGGVNAEGKKVRQGLIYRGAALWLPEETKLTRGSLDDEYRYFFQNAIGLKSEFDLRGPGEAQERFDLGEIPLEKYGVRRYCYPLHAYYPEKERNQELLREIFHELATNPEVYPMFFHCAGGADRTGMLGVLIDGVIGRDDQAILDQYEFTSFCGHSRYRFTRLAADMFRKLEDYAPGEPIRVQTARYLESIGVPHEELEAVRRVFLEE